jgi:hypothetical protein
VLGSVPREFLVLPLVKLILEDTGLLHAVRVELMLDNLLLQDFVTKLKLIHAINEVLLRNEVAGTLCARADNRRPSVT